MQPSDWDGQGAGPVPNDDTLQRRPQILHRDVRLHAESFSGSDRPTRISQQRARQQNDIRPAVRYDLCRVGRFGDHADGPGGDPA